MVNLLENVEDLVMAQWDDINTLCCILLPEGQIDGETNTHDVQSFLVAPQLFGSWDHNASYKSKKEGKNQ